jgi:hypothetical protein
MQCVSKRALQWHSNCCCVGSVTETFTLKGVQSIHPSTPIFNKCPLSFIEDVVQCVIACLCEMLVSQCYDTLMWKHVFVFLSVSFAVSGKTCSSYSYLFFLFKMYNILRLSNFNRMIAKEALNSVAWVRERTIPTDPPSLFSEGSADLCG